MVMKRIARCPVCKFDRTYSGECCDACKKLGYPKNNKPLKTLVTVRLDQDVLRILKAQAQYLGLPYQTYLNSLLKQALLGPGD